ncbi:Mu transposase C-terminal domain-containing protein [Sphingomonas oryzagri]
MLYARDVIRFDGDAPRTHRVVWADHRDVWLFDLDSTRTSFSCVARAELDTQFNARAAVIMTDHDYDARHVESALTEAQKTRREALNKVIAPIVVRAPEIFDDRVRGRAVAEVERAGVRSAKTVHAALDRWFRGGMTLDALVPDFRECGKGARREGAKRAGRKQPPGTPPGVVITPAIEDIFKKAITRFYSNDRKNALSAAYELMRGEWFVDELRDRATGALSYRTKPEYAETGFPTLRQFRYWYGKRPDRLNIRRKRLGDAKYEKDNRATTGSATRHLIGAGSRFEIDATKLEIGMVSELNPNTYLDPATFYQVTDVATSLVCGIYVGHEEASWIGAGLAVRNVVEDKVEFARRFGVEITPEQWPCQGVLPARLLADNAEFRGDLATEFTAKSHVTVENAQALRGDRKGTVEGKFNQFKTELRKRLPGIVRKNQADPDAIDDRREARLTLRQVTAAVIETVVLLNNRKLQDFNRKREMIEADVFAVPTEMWAWSVRTGMAELRSFDVATAEFAMLPTATVSVTKDGIRFKNLFFCGADPRADAFAFARQDGVSRVEISYDPLCTTNIYVHDPEAGEGYQVFKLTGGSWEYRDLSFEDAAKLMARDSAHTKNNQFAQAEADARFSRSQAALDRAGKATRTGRFKHADVARGKGNSKEERKYERSSRGSALPRTATDAAPSVVIDASRAFAEQQERVAAKRDVLGDGGMAAWLAKGSADEPA